jgi:hypothetical protein
MMKTFLSCRGVLGCEGWRGWMGEMERMTASPYTGPYEEAFRDRLFSRGRSIDEAVPVTG